MRLGFDTMERLALEARGGTDSYMVMEESMLPSTATLVGALSDASATVIVGFAGTIGTAFGFILKWLLDRRSRWDADRHRLFSEFYVAANANWDCIDADGSCDRDQFEAAYAKMRNAYTAAMFICRKTETSDALDGVHDSLAKLYETIVPDEISEPEFRKADKAVHEAMASFTNCGRQELGLPNLEQSSYEDWTETWGLMPLRRPRLTPPSDPGSSGHGSI